MSVGGRGIMTEKTNTPSSAQWAIVTDTHFVLTYSQDEDGEWSIQGIDFGEIS